MATDLVLPAPTALGMVPAHEASLVRQLRSSWNVQLQTRFTRSPMGHCLETLKLNPGLSAEAYRGALEALAQADAARAPQAQIARGLAMLTAVCVRPSDFDDAKIILWSDRLRDVCGEYPADIALGAINQWPKTEGGKFWPSEHEFRILLDFLGQFRRELKFRLEMEYGAALPHPDSTEPFEPADGLRSDPSGDVDKFVTRWSNYDPERCKIYLHGARFGDGVIVVDSMLAEMMIEKAAGEHSDAPITIKRKEYAR